MSIDDVIDGATYPVVMGATIADFAALVAVGVPWQPAAYAAVALAAVVIIALEAFRPHRREWQPDRSAVLNDAAFLALVQMVLPIVVSGVALFALASIGRHLELRVQSWWPHSWPLVAQLLLMLLIGDFFRYWMHRAFHARTGWWRFHAVHHSPNGLYWLNVGRFHPFEKTVQLAVDTLPFALVGVDDSVLAAYLVVYAVNGFFQHSNCRVRLGWGNYVISGPELHRWHHSRIIAESDNNFGNNLIVWDVLFGTRYLPTDREVEELGLLNRAYPDDFVTQMATPWRKGLDKASPT
ncbi:MAG: sterol desaturase family protein [Actinomycetota bacterium]